VHADEEPRRRGQEPVEATAATGLGQQSGMRWGYIVMLYFWVTERGLGEENSDDVWVVLQITWKLRTCAKRFSTG
jgi:hypothetical protein